MKIPRKIDSAVEWPRLATAQGTLVFLMGMTNLPKIVQCLACRRQAARHPPPLFDGARAPRNGPSSELLDDIVEKRRAARMEPPTVIVVGEVVRLRAQLNWFERRPLFGKRILVTRPKLQAPAVL